MGIRSTHIFSALLALAALPLSALAATTDFFGPIVPQSGACICATAMDWGCVVIVFHNILNALVSFGLLAVVFFIALAGFGLMTNGSDSAARTKARNRLLNAIVGLALILGAFLLVDTVLKALYDPSATFSGGAFGSWDKILAGNGKDHCLALNKNPGGLTNGTVVGTLQAIENPGTANSSSGSSGAGGPIPGSFTYDPGIQAQTGQASAALTSLLSCMAGKLPAGVGRISSISDKDIISGSKTFAQCAAFGCAHEINSCHYGGKTCVGRSFAADFGDEQNASVIKAAAVSCGANYTGFEGTHLHVSVGKSCGCN
ncbi:MAG: hypothetical protein JWL88_461 [Parcubacteria group bacterium]|nr:hypothetical protein [Parcubacteria group bacterium]